MSDSTLAESWLDSDISPFIKYNKQDNTYKCTEHNIVLRNRGRVTAHIQSEKYHPKAKEVEQKMLEESTTTKSIDMDELSRVLQQRLTEQKTQSFNDMIEEKTNKYYADEAARIAMSNTLRTAWENTRYYFPPAFEFSDFILLLNTLAMKYLLKIMINVIVDEEHVLPEIRRMYENSRTLWDQKLKGGLFGREENKEQ